MTTLSPQLPRSVGARAAIPASILLGASLLFLVEPMAGKMVLPWFGGAAGVWIACLLFFQTALCAGYVYAHLLTRLSPLRQRVLHGILLLASLAVLPIVPDAAWKPAGDSEPALRVFMLLTATIGLPFMLLSSTGPLMQAWLAGRDTLANPYRLYALSNAGSLLALLAYPALVEPLLDTSVQARLWSIAYGLFVAASLATAWLTRRSGAAAATVATAEPPLVPGEFLLWVALAAVPSMLLLAATAHITQNVAAIPLLWVVPLAIYLLTLILCFESSRFYRRPLFVIGFVEFALAMIYGAVDNRANSNPLLLVALYSAGLFTACMLCHGELAARRPAASRLTGYYLALSVGGAIGGLLVAVGAPSVFNGLYDLPVALALAGLVAIVAIRPRGALLAAAGFLWLAGAGWASYAEWHDAAGAIRLGRNFYGSLKVIEEPAPGRGMVRRLMHGTITHGEELLDPAHRCWPTSYYARESGVGLALSMLQPTGPIKAGVIGLGAGTLAAYARPGDDFRFYEIDPLMPEFATGDFGFLKECASRWSLQLGDGRLGLEAEPDRRFDLLAVDAFSGDAVPAHLLTIEALRLYRSRLNPGGVLAIHVSNQFLDLVPVVGRAAEAIGMPARVVTAAGDALSGGYLSQWVLLSDRPDFFADPRLAAAVPIDLPPGLRAWTDDYSNLWRSLR